jgi:hypothetical protein
MDEIKISSLNILGKNMIQNNVNRSPQDTVTPVVAKKRGRPSKPPTASQLLKIEDKNKRDEYKQKILKLANQLYKDDKITKALHNRMFNIGIGASRLDNLQSAYNSLNDIGDYDQKFKKHQYNKVLKQKKQEHKERKLNKEEIIDSETFIFKHEPNGDAIARVYNTFYNELHFNLPKNYDYIKKSDNKRKLTYNYMYNGEFGEIDLLLYQVFNQQKYRYKINISFGFILIRETQNFDNDKKEFEIKFKFFDVSTNTRLFKDSPAITIDNKNDLDNLVQRVNGDKAKEELIKLRDG